MSSRAEDRIVVTGLGLISAAGADLSAVAAKFKDARGCLREIRGFDTRGLQMTHAGEIPDFEATQYMSPVHARTMDAGTQLAIIAAERALADAGQIARKRTGVLIGVSGAQQYQHMVNFDTDADTPSLPFHQGLANALYMSRNAPSYQADTLARVFGLGGPRLAFASASVGSLLAIAHAMDLLRAGHADAMLVGGGEIQTLLNAKGMDTLGVSARGICQPWGENPGMCFGDAGAFLVLERMADAQARQAKLVLELLSVHFSADAYDDVGNDPAGRGLSRAIAKTVDEAQCVPSDISWIRACGIGLRSQDNAEALALNQSFPDGVPPVTSTEPYFGHVNGVSPVLGVIAGVIADQFQAAPVLPDAAAAKAPFPLLDPGTLPDGDFLLTALAFGGNNGALLAGSPFVARRQQTRAVIDIDIVGAGAVSCFGVGVPALLNGFRESGTDIANSIHVNAEMPRIPGIDMRRHEKLVQWSMTAVAEALKESGVNPRGSSRVGLLAGFAYGIPGPLERVMVAAAEGKFDATTGRDLLMSGRFSVLSKLARTFGLQSYCAATSPGVGGGIQLLTHATELLRMRDDLDALIVLAADQRTEKTDLLTNTLRNYLQNQGLHLPPIGEGAAALVLARRAPNSPVTGWGRLRGVSYGAVASSAFSDLYGGMLNVMRGSLQAVTVAPSGIALTSCASNAVLPHQSVEKHASHAITPATAFINVTQNTGLVPAANGLFATLLASERLADYPGERAYALLAGCTNRGAQSSLVLQRDGARS